MKDRRDVIICDILIEAAREDEARAWIEEHCSWDMVVYPEGWRLDVHLKFHRLTEAVFFRMMDLGWQDIADTEFLYSGDPLIGAKTMLAADRAMAEQGWTAQDYQWSEHLMVRCQFEDDQRADAFAAEFGLPA